jgi:hypothetical protein
MEVQYGSAGNLARLFAYTVLLVFAAVTLAWWGGSSVANLACDLGDRRVGQALAPEAIAECIRSGGVWEAESNIDLLDLVSIPAAADRDASFTVKCINL